MKRRGFLGLLGGAAVAGPSMAKQAINTMSDLSLGPVSSGFSNAGVAAGQIAFGGTGVPHFSSELARLLGRTIEQHREEIAKTHVHSLDPDIAEYRAIRLGSKIRMQKERDYWRGLREQKHWLERAIEELL